MNYIVKMAITAMVAVIVVVAVLPLFQPDDGGNGWAYDDYREAPEETTVSGSLELVTIGGVQYIHAKGIGEGTITTDGSTRTVLVKKAPLDLILIWGQSNAAYWVTDKATAEAPAPGTSYYFGNGSQYATGGTSAADISGWTFQSMLDDSGACKVGDKAPALCKTYTEETGRKAYIVDGAIGNRSIVTFIKNAELWTYCKSVMDAAVHAVDTDHYDLTITRYCWIQGESDNTMSPRIYAEIFGSILDDMTGGDMGYRFEGVEICLLNSRYANTNIALNEIAKTDPRAEIGASAETFSTDDGTLAVDGIHYSQKGDNIVGAEFGTSLAKARDGPASMRSVWSMAGLIPLILVVGVVFGLVSGFVRARYD